MSHTRVTLVSVIRSVLVHCYPALAAFVGLVALSIFVITAIPLLGLGSVLHAEGTFAGVLGMAWLGLSFVLSAVAIVRIVRWLRPATSSGPAGREEMTKSWSADLFVALPRGWRSGFRPDASDEAKASVHDDSECLSVAHDSTRVGQAYVPSFRVETHGVPEPGDDLATWLDAEEVVFRNAMAHPVAEGRVKAVDRVKIPAGEAIRVELSSPPEPAAPVEIAQVQYYIPTTVGLFALWFLCETGDLAGYRATFDEMARTFLRTDLHPDDYLDEFVLAATGRTPMIGDTFPG